MRCCCCDVRLTDYEATLRSAATGNFLDMCSKCVRIADIPTESRPDLEGSVTDDNDDCIWDGKVEDWEYDE